MKRLFILLTLLIAVPEVASASLQAWFDYKVFLIPGEGPFVETHISFDAKSLQYAASDGENVIASVQSTIIVKQDGEIITFKKNIINSPAARIRQVEDFTDIQRISLPNGAYTFEIELIDLNLPESTPQTLTQNFSIDFNPAEPDISDITLVKAYAPATEVSELTKSGYDIIPYVNNYFPSNLDGLIFYAEIYNTDKLFGQDGAFALVCSIRDLETNEVVSDLQMIRKMKSQPVIAVMQTLNLSSVKTGDYKLIMEIRNKENESIIAQSLDFFRNKFVDTPTDRELSHIDIKNTFVNGFTDRDSLLECIQSAQPIATNLERTTFNHQLETADLMLLQQYFYHFWVKRDATNPEAAWEAYNLEVLRVANEFGTRIKKGYQTDRGRIYLQYGPPNTRVIRRFPEDVFPYEIWHYYEIGLQHDRRLLFYDPTAVLEDFELLHSDVQGEIQNHSWKSMMRTGSSSGNSLSDHMNNLNQNQQNSFDESELEDLYYNPR